MSQDFIGSKIAIITKSQCRYVGTIIGIDTKTSSVLLGNVKCFGTENRPGHLTNANMISTIIPIMQFANSDIEDLKVVDDDQQIETPPPPPQQHRSPMPTQSSIHDDPAIVSAVVSSTFNDKAIKPKIEESHIPSNSSEFNSSWPVPSQSNWENNTKSSKPSSQQTIDNNNPNINRFQSNRSDQHISNTNSIPTLRRNEHFQREHQQQPNRYQYDNMPHNQRNFHNNYRGQRPFHQRRIGGFVGGNRETFQGFPDDIDDEFDFETSNSKFHKLTTDDEAKHENNVATNHSLPFKFDNDTTVEHPSVYDKKKSFFDNLAVSEQSEMPKSHGYGRSTNNTYRQNQYGSDNFHYKQHNNNRNAYNYRH